MPENYSLVECLLFAAGDPVPLVDLARVISMTLSDTRALLQDMEQNYRAENRGVIPLVTEQTAQMVSNRCYAAAVETLLQPEREKTASAALMETLAIIAYRQPVTRLTVEEIRGVRSEYAIAQLIKMRLVDEIGRKETLGRPILYGTTEYFLHKFHIHRLSELPDYERFNALLPTVSGDFGEV